MHFSLIIHSCEGVSGWGISWYLNGLLIPRITLYRGFEYTFIVEGGDDPSNPARYHPFYITDSERGGYLVKSEEERKVCVCVCVCVCCVLCVCVSPLSKSTHNVCTLGERYRYMYCVLHG